MIRLSEIRLPLGALPTDPETHPEAALRAAAAQALGIAPAGIAHVHVFKRSFDARKADLLANLWAKEVRARGTIEAVNYKRVAAIYKGMTGSWPSSEAISTAKRAALDKLGRRSPDSS